MQKASAPFDALASGCPVSNKLTIYSNNLKLIYTSIKTKKRPNQAITYIII